MRDDYLQELEKVLFKMEETYKKVRKTSRTQSEYSLMISRYRKTDEYFAVIRQNGKQKRRLINKDKERIYRLAHKAYISELEKRLDHNRAILKSALQKMTPADYLSLLPSLPKHFDLLDPERVMHPEFFEKGFDYPCPSEDGFPEEAQLSIGYEDPWEWACKPYCENTEYPEHKIHTTRRGIRCRSKSEALIFEIYMDLRIPFRYDEVITIGGQRISPDFRGVRADGSLVIQEHKGVHSQEYRFHNEWKEPLYAAAGFYQGINLLYTFDSIQGSLNTGLAEAMIRDMYRL